MRWWFRDEIGNRYYTEYGKQQLSALRIGQPRKWKITEQQRLNL